MYAVFRKELLQLAHHRLLRFYFILLFFAEAALIAGEIRYPGGFPVFQALFRIALFGGIFAVVAVFCVRWARERNDASLDPALTTRLAPYRILGGKFTALLSAAVLLALVGRAADFRTMTTWECGRDLLLETGRWSVLTAFVLAFNAFSRKTALNAALSGAATLLLALLLGALAAGRELLAFLLPHIAAAGAFERLFPAEIWLAALGLTAAEAGLAKKSSDRMVKLHGFFLVSVFILPLWFSYVSGSFAVTSFYRSFVAAAHLFLLLSLCERETRSPLQREKGGCIFLTTGRFPVWCWSVFFAAAAFFTAPHPAARLVDLTALALFGFYIALAQIFARRKSLAVRFAAFGIAILFCNLPVLFAEYQPLLAALAAENEFMPDSCWRAGILFAASMILRCPEFAAFFRREKI